MSNLEDFVRHNLDHKPNEVHGRAKAPKNRQDAARSQQVRRRMAAQRAGQLHGEMYYTQAQQTVTQNGVWESEETVNSRLRSKEEFPQG